MSETKQTLYAHVPHFHTLKNVNDQHAAERAEQVRGSLYRRFNDNAAVWITRIFSTMALFWALDLFLIIWMAGNSVGIWHFDPAPFPLLLFLWNIPQLPLLPLLAIGATILGRKQALQNEEQYNTALKSAHDLEQIAAHQAAQDNVLLNLQARAEHSEQLLLLLLEHLGVEAPQTTGGEFPAVRFNHKMRVDEDQLRISLARAGIRPELLGGLPPWIMLALEELRPHAHEEAQARQGHEHDV